MNINELKYGIKYFFANSIITHIPSWTIRKRLFKLIGMKIGKSHILRGVVTDGWNGIVIRNGVCINQRCHIDGRGGLIIEDNVSISIGTVILSASHDKDSSDFKYTTRTVHIGKRVWLGANCIVLPGVDLSEGVVIAAGSVAIPQKYEKFGVYSGVPAVKISDRSMNITYDLSSWDPILR